MMKDKPLMIAFFLSAFVFAIFFLLTIPVLNFIYKKPVEVVETPLPPGVTVYDPHYITDCEQDFSCFLDFARNCEQVLVEKDEEVIEVIGEKDGSCFFHKSALCIVPMEEFLSILDEWESADDFLPVNSKWCEDTLYQW